MGHGAWWRVLLGWVQMLFLVAWNGRSLWLFRRHQTGLLPGQATNAIIKEGPYRFSRNPLYIGLALRHAQPTAVNRPDRCARGTPFSCENVLHSSQNGSITAEQPSTPSQ